MLSILSGLRPSTKLQYRLSIRISKKDTYLSVTEMRSSGLSERLGIIRLRNTTDPEHIKDAALQLLSKHNEITFEYILCVPYPI